MEWFINRFSFHWLHGVIRGVAVPIGNRIRAGGLRRSGLRNGTRQSTLHLSKISTAVVHFLHIAHVGSQTGRTLHRSRPDRQSHQNGPATGRFPLDFEPRDTGPRNGARASPVSSHWPWNEADGIRSAAPAQGAVPDRGSVAPP